MLDSPCFTKRAIKLIFRGKAFLQNCPVSRNTHSKLTSRNGAVLQTVPRTGPMDLHTKIWNAHKGFLLRDVFWYTPKTALQQGHFRSWYIELLVLFQEGQFCETVPHKSVSGVALKIPPCRSLWWNAIQCQFHETALESQFCETDPQKSALYTDPWKPVLQNWPLKFSVLELSIP